MKYTGHPEGLPFEPADLDALDAANHLIDLRDEHFDNTWRDRDDREDESA